MLLLLAMFIGRLEATTLPSAFGAFESGGGAIGSSLPFSFNRPVPVARATLVSAGSDPLVYGDLTFSRIAGSNAISIEGLVFNLTPGLHGFHIHTKGKLTNQCKDAAGHFNPEGVDHAGPLRHAGDLGNIVAVAGTAATPVRILDAGFTLGDGGPRDAFGRAVMVHAGADDLGRGGDAGSRKAGNAGPRVACGVIRPL